MVSQVLWNVVVIVYFIYTPYILVQFATHKKQTLLIKRRKKLDSGNWRVVDYFSKVFDIVMGKLENQLLNGIHVVINPSDLMETILQNLQLSIT